MKTALSVLLASVRKRQFWSSAVSSIFCRLSGSAGTCVHSSSSWDLVSRRSCGALRRTGAGNEQTTWPRVVSSVFWRIARAFPAFPSATLAPFPQSSRGLDHRRVSHVFQQAVLRSGVRGAGRLSLHSLHHGYASLLIGHNVNPQFVSRQLGHANPSVTLRVYSHFFARREHSELARRTLDASYAAMMSRKVHEGDGAVQIVAK